MKPWPFFVEVRVRQCPCGYVELTFDGFRDGEARYIGWFGEGRVTDWPPTSTCEKCGWSLSDKSLDLECCEEALQ